MLNHEWRPENMVVTEEQWADTVLPHDGYLDSLSAARLMVAFEAQAQDWLNHVANAVLYKETLKFKRESQYALAFFQSQGKSDKQKDIEAKQDPMVRVSDARLAEALAALKLAEGKYDSAVRSHHGMKALLKEAADERWLK
jgi:hypothetical protein